MKFVVAQGGYEGLEELFAVFDTAMEALEYAECMRDVLLEMEPLVEAWREACDKQDEHSLAVGLQFTEQPLPPERPAGTADYFDPSWIRIIVIEKDVDTFFFNIENFIAWMKRTGASSAT